MKIFFMGDSRGNYGPANVNREIKKRLSTLFIYEKSTNKYLRWIELLIKSMFCKVIVISGVSRQGSVLMNLAKKMGKKTVYIMHGCSEYEYRINRETVKQEILKQEKNIMSKADLILPVSEKYSICMKKGFPQYADKIKPLTNGISSMGQPANRVRDRHPQVVAIGGNQLLKNNIVVGRVIAKMNGRVNFVVYGRIKEHLPKESCEYMEYMGQVSQQQLAHAMQSSQLFVLNSVLESFSLSVIDALNNGCSVLVSEIAGVTDVLDMQECDVIHDPMNEQEIQEKIEYLLEHPNNERLCASVDYDKWSYEKQVERLQQYCLDSINE